MGMEMLQPKTLRDMSIRDTSISTLGRNLIPSFIKKDMIRFISISFSSCFQIQIEHIRTHLGKFYWTIIINYKGHDQIHQYFIFFLFPDLDRTHKNIPWKILLDCNNKVSQYKCQFTIPILYPERMTAPIFSAKEINTEEIPR